MHKMFPPLLTYCAQSRVDEAIPLCEQAIAIMEAALGPQPLHKHQKIEERASLLAQIASALSSLAHMYKSKKWPDKAEKLLLRALQITETALGPDHYQMGTCMNNLGMLHMSLRHLDQAKECFLQALAIIQKIFGCGAPETAPILKNWAKLLELQAEACTAGRKSSTEELELAGDLKAHAAVMHRCAQNINEKDYNAVQAADEIIEVKRRCTCATSVEGMYLVSM